MRSARCPIAADEAASIDALGIPWCPPEIRDGTLDGEPPALVELADMRGDLHVHTTWSDGRATVDGDGVAAARAAATSTSRSATTRRRSASCPGLDAATLRRQGEEIAAANEQLAPFRILRGVECDIRDDGASTRPTTCWPSSTGSSSRCTAGSACRAAS